MADEWKAERLEGRVAELDKRIRRVERHCMAREAFWEKISDRAFVATAAILATVTAVVVADRRAR